MKRKYNKTTFLELTLALALLCNLSITYGGATSATVKLFNQNNGNKDAQNPNTLKQILKSGVTAEASAFQAKTQNGGKTMPESEEAKQQRHSGVKEKKIPNQRMKNDNFSNIDDGYKRMTDDIFETPTEKDKPFDGENLEEVTGLLGSIENSVRNDVVDVSSFARRRNRFKSYENMNDLSKLKKVNQDSKMGNQFSLARKTEKEPEKMEKNTQKLLSDNNADKNDTKSLSSKKLESSLSNEGRKKANENKIVFDGNFMVEKKLENIESGDVEKESSGSGESGDEDEIDDDEMTKTDKLHSINNRKRNDKIIKEASRIKMPKLKEDSTTSNENEFKLPEEEGSGKLMEKEGDKNVEEEGSSNGNDDEEDYSGEDTTIGYNEEKEHENRKITNGSKDPLERSFDKISIGESNQQKEEYSGYMKEWINEDTKEWMNEKKNIKGSSKEEMNYSGKEIDNHNEMKLKNNKVEINGKVKGEAYDYEQDDDDYEDDYDYDDGDTSGEDNFSGKMTESSGEIETNEAKNVEDNAAKLMTEESEEMQQSSGNEDLKRDETTEESGSGSGNDENMVADINDANAFDRSKAEWKTYAGKMEEEGIRENSKSHEERTAELQKDFYQNFKNQGSKEMQEPKNESGIISNEKNHTRNEMRYGNSSSKNQTQGMKQNATDNVSNVGTQNFTDIAFANLINATSEENVKVEYFAKNATSKDNRTSEDEKSLQELNKEIKEEEDKSKAMMNYLEKIDEELGEKANENIDTSMNISKLTNDEKSRINLLTNQSFGAKNDSFQGKIMPKSNETNNSTVEKHEINGKDSKNEKEEEIKEVVLKKGKVPQGDNKTKGKNKDEEGKVIGSFANDDDIKINRFIKDIYGDLEKKIEGKVESEIYAQEREQITRKKIDKTKEQHDIVENMIETVTKNNVEKEGEEVELKDDSKYVSGNKKYADHEMRKIDGTVNAAIRDVIVVNLHGKNQEENKMDKSKRTERPKIDNKDDVILKYKRIYGGNSTLVADFAEGETAAKLYIYPKKKEENAQKKNVVVKNEAGEKRNRKYIFNDRNELIY